MSIENNYYSAYALSGYFNKQKTMLIFGEYKFIVDEEYSEEVKNFMRAFSYLKLNLEVEVGEIKEGDVDDLKEFITSEVSLNKNTDPETTAISLIRLCKYLGIDSLYINGIDILGEIKPRMDMSW